jgi:hypothetical protein
LGRQALFPEVDHPTPQDATRRVKMQARAPIPVEETQPEAAFIGAGTAFAQAGDGVAAHQRRNLFRRDIEQAAKQRGIDGYLAGFWRESCGFGLGVRVAGHGDDSGFRRERRDSGQRYNKNISYGMTHDKAGKLPVSH